MISRDAYEHLREELAVRMRTQTARRIYARRAPIGEGVFATLKATLGFRRFSCRGRSKVEAELLWICTAYNLMKLIRKVSAGPKTPLKHPQTLRNAFLSIAAALQRVWRGPIRRTPVRFPLFSATRLRFSQLPYLYAMAN